MNADIPASFSVQLFQGGIHVGNWLILARVGGAQNAHHANGVFVAQGRNFGARSRKPIARHRHETGLDVPITEKLLPAHLDGTANNNVGPVGGLALGTAAVAPPAVHRETR